MDFLAEIKYWFAKTIINEIKGSFPIYKSYDIKLSGGGAEQLGSYLSKYFDFDIIKDSVFANAIGFYNVGCDMDE